MANALDFSRLTDDWRAEDDLLDGWFERDAFRFDDAAQRGPAVFAAPGLAAVLVAEPDAPPAAEVDAAVLALPQVVMPAPDGAGIATAVRAPVAAPLPTYTNTQIADYLEFGFWDWFGEGPRAFNLGASGIGANNRVLYYNVGGLTAAGRNLAENALAIYEEVLGVDFVGTTSTGDDVDFFFQDHEDGAYAFSELHGATTVVDYSVVNVSVDWLATFGTAIGTYSFQTYLHEIGHALGLGHAGAYNGFGNYVTDTTDPNYGNNSNVYLNDSWQASVMSYFDQLQNTTVAGDFAYVISPMIADWVALGKMYGISAGAFDGDTTWGFNTTITSTVFANLTAYSGDAAFTVIDAGGVDTLDFSGYFANQLINLNAGAVSNISDRIGNMVIAAGTQIENAKGGSGDDTLIGNSAANSLYGGGGGDSMNGGAGGDTYYVGDAGDTVTETSATGGFDIVYSSVSFTLGANLETLRMIPGSGAVNGTGNNLANEIWGTSAANILRGLGGGDSFTSGDGADTVIGGLGRDLFLYAGVIGSSPAAIDRVAAGDGAIAFERAGARLGDRFDLSAIDANEVAAGFQHFVFGSATGPGRLWAMNSGPDTLIRGNVDDDPAAEFQVAIADGAVAASAYAAADFLV